MSVIFLCGWDSKLKSDLPAADRPNVHGKSYHLCGVQLTHARNLHKRITIVCLRSFPRCAYEEHFTGVAEWLLAISFSAMGIFLLLLYFFVT